MNLKHLVLGAHIALSRLGSLTFSAGAGTVSVTNGSTALVGVGTGFESLAVGQTIGIATGPLPGQQVFVQITTITDDTHIVLSAEWAGDTLAGLSYGKQAANLSSPTIKPVSTVPANWTYLGTCLDLDYQRNATREKVVAPFPGSYEPIDRIYVGSAPTAKITLNDVSELEFESIFGVSVPVVDTTPFTPFSGAGDIRGWWQIKKYDSAQNLVLLIEQYGIGSFAGIKSENKQAKPVLEIDIMANLLATGTSTLAAA